MNQLSIEVKHLTKRFATFTAVDGVTFSVKAGEIFGFLGANGAGKSTTIRMLCALLCPTSGTATVRGYDIIREPEKVKQNIGYMSQKFSLYEDLTVEENIQFFGGVYGLTKRRIQERMPWILEMAGLKGREKALPRELSVGWKQRLALGCAVLHEPGVVFLDEPTGGVDPISRREFWELINDLSGKGVTVFITTHYLDEAEYCNTIMLLHAGMIIAGGSPQDLKIKHITNPLLEVECDRCVETMELLQGQDWVVTTSIFGTYLHLQVSEEEDGKLKLKKLLSEHGLKAKRIDRIMPSLEDVVIHLIEEKTKKGETER